MSHPENRFIQTIHRKLRPVKKQVPFYFAKLQVAGNNGFPDCWYSGTLGDLWAEYKWVSDRDFPVRDTSSITVALSANQRNWLNGRHKEGRQVCCIVGSPKGHLILHHPFPEKISVAHFLDNAIDTAAVVGYILEKTTVKPS